MAKYRSPSADTAEDMDILSLFSLTLMAGLLPLGDHVLLTLGLLCTPYSSWKRMVALFSMASFIYSG